MTGIEVLSTSEIVSKYAYNRPTICIAFGVTFCIFLTIGIAMSVEMYDWTYLFLGIFSGIIIGFCVAGLIWSITSTPEEYETRYKIAISDEVLMNEFFEKYELLEQEGKIYTVRER